jgi:DNA polymerase III alpha subunit
MRNTSSKLCEAFAGLPPGRADVLRRALNKQKRAVIEEIHGEFFASALARGHAPEKTAEVWELGHRLCGLRFLQGAQHRLRRGGVSIAWLK